MNITTNPTTTPSPAMPASQTPPTTQTTRTQ